MAARAPATPSGSPTGSPARSIIHAARPSKAPRKTGSQPSPAKARASGRHRATCPAPIAAPPSQRTASSGREVMMGA